MSNKDHESDDTLDLVRSMRDTIRDFTIRAEVQNASIKDSFSGGFLGPVSEEPEDLDANFIQTPPENEVDLRDH